MENFILLIFIVYSAIILWLSYKIARIKLLIYDISFILDELKKKTNRKEIDLIKTILKGI